MEEWSLTVVPAGILARTALFGMMFGVIFLGALADKIGRKNSNLICIIFLVTLRFGVDL